MKIILATGNKFKADEILRILDLDLELIKLDLDEVQDMDLRKVALYKLNQAYDLVKKPVIIDDVSLSIHAWNGFPGPLIKWMLKAGNGPGLILKILEKEKDRGAFASLAIGFHDGKNPHVFIGSAKGKISHEIRGDNGFGWDKVFIPHGYNKTYAEMEPELKDAISHRGIALSKFKDFLKANYDI